jgi:hypothetical protein
MAYFFGYTMAYFLWFGLYGLVSIIWYYLVLFGIILYSFVLFCMIWYGQSMVIVWHGLTIPNHITYQTKQNQTKQNKTKQNQTI